MRTMRMTMQTAAAVDWMLIPVRMKDEKNADFVNFVTKPAFELNIKAF